MTATSTHPHAAPRRSIPPRTLHPDPARLAAILARTWLEIRSGQRPFAQLARHVAPAARRRLEMQLASRTATPAGSPARIRRVVASEPASGACEACVLVEQDGRTTALAVRLERHRGVWRVVELTAPEAGLAPLCTASLPEGMVRRDAFDEAADEAVDTVRSFGDDLPAVTRRRDSV